MCLRISERCVSCYVFFTFKSLGTKMVQTGKFINQGMFVKWMEVGVIRELGGCSECVRRDAVLGDFTSRVGRERCSHVHEHLFAFTVRKYCSELNTV